MICVYIVLGIYLFRRLTGLVSTFRNWDDMSILHGDLYPFLWLLFDILLIWVSVQAICDVIHISIQLK
jgi:hypothetical protein